MRSVATASFFDITLAAIAGSTGRSRWRRAARRARRRPGRGSATARRPRSRPRRPGARAPPARGRCASPGIDSSLSSVPPVWPRPRPDSFATARPSAAASGANTRVTPSATPPVECLSTVGRGRSPERDRVARVDHRRRERKRLLVVESRGARGHEERRRERVGDLAAGVTLTKDCDSSGTRVSPSRFRGDDVRGSEGSCGVAPLPRGWSIDLMWSGRENRPD